MQGSRASRTKLPSLLRRSLVRGSSILGGLNVAIAWGPLVGYCARESKIPLRVRPVSPQIDVPYLPFVFDIAMGVRHGETAWRDTLDSVIGRHQKQIDSILTSYGVPLVR